jgi:[ribosomal protein S5]-alanine N-acetyltransferase
MLSLPETLRTERLVLQRLRYEDAEEIFYTYASKPEATRFVAWPTHKSVDDTRKFLSFAINSWSTGKDYSYTVRLKDQNRLIGSIGVVNLDYKVQFGYIFSPTQWNNGYATETCRRILEVLRAEARITGITTFVDVENIYSIRVLEKCGMTAEGVFPKWFQFPNQENMAKDCILFAYRPHAKAAT